MKNAAKVLVLSVVFLLPAYYLRFNFLGVPTNPIEFLVLASFLLLLITSKKSFRWPLLLPISLIVLGMGIGTFLAIDQAHAIGILKGWVVVPILFYWSFYNSFSATDRPILNKLLTLNVGLVGLAAVLQWSGVLSFVDPQILDIQQYISQGRAFAFFESPNLLAMYLVPLTFLALYSWEAKWPGKQWTAIAVLSGGVAILAVILSGSRGGILAMGVAAAWTIFRTNLRPRLSATFIGLALLVFGLIAWQSGQAGSDQTRLMIWQTAAEVVRDYPILGIGPGQFQYYLSGPITEAPNYLTEIYPYAIHPHNIFLNFWLSGGLLALVGFCWVLVSAVKKFWKEPRNSRLLAPMAGLAAILTHGMVDSTFFKNDLAIIFWLMIALIYLGGEQNNENRN